MPPAPPTPDLAGASGSAAEPAVAEVPVEAEARVPELAYAPAEAHPVVEAVLAELAPGPPAVDPAIAAGDNMFRFILDQSVGYREIALSRYFRSGWDAWDVVRSVLAWRFGERLPRVRLLDMASGHGRTTRFLVSEKPAESIWVSDIFAEAVAFQRRRFGVQGFASAADPAEVADPGRFDAIVVLSLFSHLPRERFLAWLATLWRWLTPDGLLLFSVHGEEVLDAGLSMSEEGFCYHPASEIGVLPAKDYGTAWATEAFLDRALAEVSGGAAAWRRLPRGLWHFQDLCAVTRRGACDLSGLPFERGPEGFLELCRREGADRLVVGGWALDRGRPGGRVTVGVATEHGRWQVSPDLVRPDVGGTASAGPSGWLLDCVAEGGSFSPSELLRVRMTTESGATRLLHVGSLEGTALYLPQLQQAPLRLRRLEEDLRRSLAEIQRMRADLEWLGNEVAARDARIATMRASRFWKLRERWFAVKRALALTAER